ncbi:MAG: carboxypeptidase-like regulatory domain-containing protein [Ferruginibacter sp.]
MAEEKTNIIYTAADIQKYLAGRMAPAEMHAMEKAALDDPFLAEAMEGYEAMMKDDLDEQLAFLKEKFTVSDNTKVVALKPARRFTLWKAAAAVLVICSGISITYLLTDKQKNVDSQIASLPPQADSAKGVTAETNKQDSITAKDNLNEAVAIESQAAKNITQKELPVIKDSAFMYTLKKKEGSPAPQTAGGGYIENLENQSRDVATTNKLSTPEQNSFQPNQQLNGRVERAANNEYKINADKGTAAIHTFTAQVVSPENKPIPFANVIVTNKNLSTYADANGTFNLVAPDSLLSIDVKSIGYEPKKLLLRSNPSNTKIVLYEDDLAQRSGIVVGKRSDFFNKDKRRSTIVQDSLMEAEPEDGWSNYDAYLNNNLSLSNEIPKKIKGDVEVSFDVLDNGAITNMKVDKSLCDNCDKEVLRIIKEGPKWKVKKGKKASAKVRVKF